MLKRYLPLFLLPALFLSCSKNKLETKPGIELKSMNTDVFPGQTLDISLDFTDKEGDLGGGVLVYKRQRLNIRGIPDAQSNDKADSIATSLPTFPKSTFGNFVITLPYDFLTEDPNDNDTMVFHIYAIDVGGHSSDTITTPMVIEHQN